MSQPQDMFVEWLRGTFADQGIEEMLVAEQQADVMLSSPHSLIQQMRQPIDFIDSYEQQEVNMDVQAGDTAAKKRGKAPGKARPKNTKRYTSLAQKEAHKRYRERKRQNITLMEKEVQEKLQLLQLLEAENEQLKSKCRVLETSVNCSTQIHGLMQLLDGLNGMSLQDSTTATSSAGSSAETSEQHLYGSPSSRSNSSAGVPDTCTLADIVNNNSSSLLPQQQQYMQDTAGLKWHPCIHSSPQRALMQYQLSPRKRENYPSAASFASLTTFAQGNLSRQASSVAGVQPNPFATDAAAAQQLRQVLGTSNAATWEAAAGGLSLAAAVTCPPLAESASIAAATAAELGVYQQHLPRIGTANSDSILVGAGNNGGAAVAAAVVKFLTPSSSAVSTEQSHLNSYYTGNQQQQQQQPPIADVYSFAAGVNGFNALFANGSSGLPSSSNAAFSAAAAVAAAAPGGPLNGAVSSVQEGLTLYKDYLQQASALLLQLEGASPEVAAVSTHQLEEMTGSMMSRVQPIIVAKGQGLVYEWTSRNLETYQYQEPPDDLWAKVLAEMQLSAQQKEDMLACYCMFGRCLSKLVDKRIDLTAQYKALQQEADDAMKVPEGNPDKSVAEHTQIRLTSSSMEVLQALAKNLAAYQSLDGVFVHSVTSILSGVQMAAACVHCYPFLPQWHDILQHLQLQAEAEQQQRLEEQEYDERQDSGGHRSSRSTHATDIHAY